MLQGVNLGRAQSTRGPRLYLEPVSPAADKRFSMDEEEPDELMWDGVPFTSPQLSSLRERGSQGSLGSSASRDRHGRRKSSFV